MKLINKARSLKQSQTDIDHLLWQDVDLNKPPKRSAGRAFPAIRAVCRKHPFSLSLKHGLQLS
ncbi:MAG: hypothetical protein LUQ56_07670 [Methylococcaceae bacterium]|nr:hypothetical protein [Methylococcaceae bacterium]MDD1637996.1 hypothetical protein [Methylococcaceae bacterium]